MSKNSGIFQRFNNFYSYFSLIYHNNVQWWIISKKSKCVVKYEWHSCAKVYLRIIEKEKTFIRNSIKSRDVQQHPIYRYTNINLTSDIVANVIQSIIITSNRFISAVVISMYLCDAILRMEWQVTKYLFIDYTL